MIGSLNIWIRYPLKYAKSRWCKLGNENAKKWVHFGGNVLIQLSKSTAVGTK